ncbi:Aste57867_25307 [Aphanomyces stellatus]|uniref:Aste57867_25307 protein n=1 Tax=Aphanomyces stellatus TaxID=120398 RepID=A0A485LSR1_9STRA|nr:hypothetical protein As57867_025229 [Aphanomyces stellatus]VFU01932.1 Aste57867_25307 [Aphanomyces stellatus]
MQVEHQPEHYNFYHQSSHPAAMMHNHHNDHAPQYHCRYPNKQAFDVKDETAVSQAPLPSLQTFQYDRHHYHHTDSIDQQRYNQAMSTQTNYYQQAAAHQQNNQFQQHYDPYPHASYNPPYQYDRTKHLDPALLEEALNECMPFIEPMMATMSSSTNDGHHHRANPVATRYDTSPSSSYDQQHQQQFPAVATYDYDESGTYSPSSDSQHHKQGVTTTGGSQRLCRVAGCNKGIRSRGLCKGHGGGRRCQTAGCKISDQGGGHCIAHGGGRRCSVKDCTRSAQARGLCKCHGGGRPCKYAGCTKNSQRSGYCMAHGKLMGSSSVKVETDDGSVQL